MSSKTTVTFCRHSLVTQIPRVKKQTRSSNSQQKKGLQTNGLKAFPYLSKRRDSNTRPLRPEDSSTKKSIKIKERQRLSTWSLN